MNLKILEITPEQWVAHLAAQAHLCVFNEARPADFYKISYALLAVDMEIDKAVGYMTCRELDTDTVYWLHGGRFPTLAHASVAKVYNAFRKYHAARYVEAYTMVRNDNVRYLRLAMAEGFRVIGTKTLPATGEIFLECVNRLREPAPTYLENLGANGPWDLSPSQGSVPASAF